jgi:hypothetical protein
MTTSDDAVFTSKVYLVRIKENDLYSSEDILLAIGQVGKDNVDYEDFSNIVKLLNERGLWTPILSSVKTTWKSIKNSAECKALKIEGNPVLLLEGVHTFKEILDFLYTKRIMTNARGKEILDLKTEEAKLKSGKGGGKVKRTSKTIADAISDPSIGGAVPASSIIETAMEQSQAFSAEKTAIGLPGVQMTSSLYQLSRGPLYLPPPVPVRFVGPLLADQSASGQSSSCPVPGQMDHGVGQPELGVGQAGQGVGQTGQGGGQTGQGGSQPGQGGDQLGQGGGQQGHGVGFPAGMGGVAVGAAIVAGGGVLHENFDPSNFNIDAIDNEIEVLDEAADLGAQAKASRYQSLCRTLRKSLGFACATSQKLLRTSDAAELKLREFKAYSATEVITGLQPTMAKIESCVTKVASLLELVKGLDEKFVTEVASLRVVLTDLASDVANNAEISTQQSNNILRHLATFGIIDVGSSFNIPDALKEVHGMLKDEIVPVFTSGQICPVGSAPVFVDSATGQVVPGALDVGGTQPGYGHVGPGGDGQFGNVTATHMGVTMAQPGVGQPNWAQGDHGSAPQSGFQGGQGVFVSQGGLLPIPDVYRNTAVNFLGSLAPQNNVSYSYAQASPMVTPSKTSQYQQHPSYPPPPPAKRFRQEVSASGTDAVKSMFQSYASPAKPPSMVGMPGAIIQGAPVPPPNQPSAYFPPQFQQSQALYYGGNKSSAPSVPAQVSGHGGQPAPYANGQPGPYAGGQPAPYAGGRGSHDGRGESFFGSQ